MSISIADSLPLAYPLWRCPHKHKDVVNNINPVELIVKLTTTHMHEANMKFWEKKCVARNLKPSCSQSLKKLSGLCKVWSWKPMAGVGELCVNGEEKPVCPEKNLLLCSTCTQTVNACYGWSSTIRMRLQWSTVLVSPLASSIIRRMKSRERGEGSCFVGMSIMLGHCYSPECRTEIGRVRDNRGW